MRPGEWFGTASALLERGRRITAVARTDVHLLRVPGDELRGRPAALGEQALGVRSGSRHVFRNPGLASGARNALQRVQEHVQPRRGRVLAPATGGAQLQVADRDRTSAPARWLRTSRDFRATPAIGTHLVRLLARSWPTPLASACPQSGSPSQRPGHPPLSGRCWGKADAARTLATCASARSGSISATTSNKRSRSRSAWMLTSTRATNEPAGVVDSCQQLYRSNSRKSRPGSRPRHCRTPRVPTQPLRPRIADAVPTAPLRVPAHRP